MKKQTQAAMVLIAMMSSNAIAEEILKDPATRDEDLSHTRVSVDIQRDNEGNYVYRYTVISPAENKGDISLFAVDLTCNKNFEASDLPYPVGKEGYIDLNEFPELVALKEGDHTPGAVTADYGSAAPYGIDMDNRAYWGIGSTLPGETTAGLQIVSPAEPGIRVYTLKPYMDTDGWAYPEDPDPAHPWIQEFTVYGMIAGPGCPGVTPPVDSAYYPGTEFGPNDINGLLTYSTPLKDRFHVGAEVSEVEITIHYSELIDPKTFKVEPGWARPFFNPKPGGTEVVVLPLKQAINKFKFQVVLNMLKGPNKRKNAYSTYHDTDLFEIRRDTVKKNSTEKK